MKIGFDAKRVFFNRSGLGNYGRSTVELLARYAPENECVLFTPHPGNPMGFAVPDGVRTITPVSGLNRSLGSVWRSYNMSGSLLRQGIDLYHGLSNELPADIYRAAEKGVRSVVTLHDIIFVHFPELYKPFDRYLYTRKYKSSCVRADRVIAISRQTRDDLVNHWNVPEEKIDVVYQGCNPIFYDEATSEKRAEVRERYHLPKHYILSVGTIEPRKNLMLTVQAMAEGRLDADLVACGRSTPYVKEIMDYALRHGIANRVYLIHDVSFADLPAVYQMADVLVYVSFYEGFGIPILEGLNSRIPVITTRGGVFPETGGDACCYVDPHSTEEMVVALEKTLNDSDLRSGMIERGRAYARQFHEEHIAANLTDVYRRTITG
ncbi:MAG: glycosyltransferase family 4 protein [Rikenellaceae bacterium]|jgi:glycosyltransferase involved in cell wall biosynthesis|nr:glycosyltransferase family 4 protein [Rikenellaceae bacterium]